MRITYCGPIYPAYVIQSSENKVIMEIELKLHTVMNENSIKFKKMYLVGTELFVFAQEYRKTGAVRVGEISKKITIRLPAEIAEIVNLQFFVRVPFPNPLEKNSHVTHVNHKDEYNYILQEKIREFKETTRRENCNDAMNIDDNSFCNMIYPKNELAEKESRWHTIYIQVPTRSKWSDRLIIKKIYLIGNQLHVFAKRILNEKREDPGYLTAKVKQLSLPQSLEDFTTLKIHSYIQSVPENYKEKSTETLTFIKDKTEFKEILNRALLHK